jgi:hypothetical protein
LGREYAANILADQLRQRKEAKLEFTSAEERKKLMSGSAPLVNVNPGTDTHIAIHVFESLQREVEAQFQTLHEDEPQDEHGKKALSDHKITLLRALSVKDDAVQKFKANARSRDALPLLVWATAELKKLDNRPETDMQQTVDVAFAEALAEKLDELKEKAHLSQWEDKAWHAKVSRGKSLVSLSSLLSEAGGVGPVKVEWQSPLDMDLLWLDRAWFSTVGSEAHTMWSSRPLSTPADQRTCAQTQNIDIYRLQEELAERGMYAKFSRKLSESLSRKRALAEFAGELRCIWWLNKDLVQIAQELFPEVGQSFDVLWNVVRAQLSEWREVKMARNTNIVWYDSHHTLLSDATAGSNTELCTSLQGLFHSAMVDCAALYADKPKPDTSAAANAAQHDLNGILQSPPPSESSINTDAMSIATTDGAGGGESKSPADTGRNERYEMSVLSPELPVDLFIGGVDANDIRQGATLQDCWLLSALSILAGEKGDGNTFIDDLFSRHVVNGRLFQSVKDPSSKAPPGTDYHILKFFRADKDEWEHIVIDDMVPAARPLGGKSKGDGVGNVANNAGKSVYGHSREPETWVMQIEKAYAKWLRSIGGYDGLNLGLVTEALVALTGGASQELNLRSSEIQAEARSGKLWEHLNRLYCQGAMLGAGSPAGEDSFWDSSGIVQGHAYAILDMRMVQIPNGAGGGYQSTGMLLLRNPWGRNPWDMEPPMWYVRVFFCLKTPCFQVDPCVSSSFFLLLPLVVLLLTNWSTSLLR